MTSKATSAIDFQLKDNVEWPITGDDPVPVETCCDKLLDAIMCQVQPTGLCIAEGEYCGYTVYFSPKTETSVFYNPELQQYETLPMGIQTTPYKPTDSQVCAEAQYAAFELTAGVTDVATIIADVLAANPLTFDLAGNEVAVTPDDIAFIKVTPKQCGTLTSEGEEVLIDYINVNDSAASDFVDLEEGGVDGATAIEVPVGGCALVDVCFKICMSKQEVAGLGGEG